MDAVFFVVQFLRLQLSITFHKPILQKIRCLLLSTIGTLIETMDVFTKNQTFQTLIMCGQSCRFKAGETRVENTLEIMIVGQSLEDT